MHARLGDVVRAPAAGLLPVRGLPAQGYRRRLVSSRQPRVLAAARRIADRALTPDTAVLCFALPAARTSLLCDAKHQLPRQPHVRDPELDAADLHAGIRHLVRRFVVRKLSVVAPPRVCAVTKQRRTQSICR